MNPQKIVELANLLRNKGDKILNSEFAFTLSGSLLRALNDSFTLITDSLDNGGAKNFQVLKTINAKSSVFRDLQLIYDFVQKTPVLCIVHYPSEEYFEGPIDISKFRALKRLEVQKTHIQQVIGIQPLRAQLQQIICVKSIHSVDDIITKCGGDNSNGFVWNELQIADFSYNNLKQVDTSLEFAQYLQHLNLRHNQLQSVAAIKWLPYLKTLDLSFNRLLAVPQFHMDACKRLETLNMSNNLLEDLMGIVKLDMLSDLDISDNCLLDHSYLLPLSVLLCLKTLNLYGNPLHCHPKHRLATAQYLNKKCAAIKFVLDYEPLTKKEKNLLGSQKLKQVGALNRYSVRSSSTALSTPGRLTPASNHTPSSSLGSIRSFFHLNGSDISEINTTIETQKPKVLKRKSKNKNRTVEIEDSVCTTVADNVDSQFQKHLLTKSHQSNDSMSKSLLLENQQNQDHLETKRHVENLRKKYGNEWLQEDKVEILNSVLGLANNSLNHDIERNKSRQLFQEYIQLVPQNQTFDKNNETNNTIRTSTPTEEMHNNTIASEPDISPIPDNLANATIYQTPEQTQVNSCDISAYQSIESDHDHGENQNKTANENVLDLDSIYKQQNNSNDMDVSEPEEDEETYIAYRVNSKEPIFLTKSFHFLRERDTITKRTKCKWSLKILESCDRIKANTLRINFDTVKLDKQERIYTVAEDLCHKLEKDLRDILSQRDLTEMNQTVYRCVNCNCQFSQEQRFQYKQSDIHCPNCKSTFVAEMHELSKSVEKAPKPPKLSPAAIVEELPDTIIPLRIQQELVDSIGKGSTTLSEINPEHLANTNMKANTISSANSLNDSSSCTKITGNNSEGSLNSQHSLVGVASINVENYVKSNGDSDIDIISNPSQSSIEVLGDSNGESRKTSEERHVSQVPNLETIDDSSCTPTHFEREFRHHHQDHNESKESREVDIKEGNGEGKSVPLAVLDIPENGFAGYPAHDSGATNEQQTEVNTNSEFLTQETNANSTNTRNNESNGSPSKKNETNSLSSMFGGLFQSTNVLMSSSKKLLEAESSINPIYCQPYKFNYSDFNDIDHRLKLFLYQTQFKERDEHFKWLVKGHLYNPQTAIACKGLIIISTCKCYIMEAFAVEHDDVGKWLKPIVTCTIDRLEQMQLLPWKLGLTIKLKDWGTILLLLQDILRTDSLMLYFANNSLPSQCALIYQPCDVVNKRLTATVADQQLKMFSLLNACEITFERAKRSLNLCGLITTDSHIYLTTPKIGWLCADNDQTDVEVCVAQLMTNLVEVERLTEEIILVSFLDENVNKEEQWRCSFETSDNATSCLNAVAQSWEKLFGVPLINP